MCDRPQFSNLTLTFAGPPHTALVSSPPLPPSMLEHASKTSLGVGLIQPALPLATEKPTASDALQTTRTDNQSQGDGQLESEDPIIKSYPTAPVTAGTDPLPPNLAE